MKSQFYAHPASISSCQSSKSLIAQSGSTTPESSALLALESELSTTPHCAEKQSTRFTDLQLLSSAIQRSPTSYVWKHMPGPINFIYTRGQRVRFWYSVVKSATVRLLNKRILRILRIRSTPTSEQRKVSRFYTTLSRTIYMPMIGTSALRELRGGWESVSRTLTLGLHGTIERGLQKLN